MGCKKGLQKKKKACEERILKTDSSPPPKKRDKPGLEMLKRQKKAA